MIIFIVAALFSVIGMIVGGQLKRKFKKYSKISLSNGMSGAEIAANKLKETTDNQAKQIIIKGDQTAKGIMDNAKIQTDKLESEADIQAEAIRKKYE